MSKTSIKKKPSMLSFSGRVSPVSCLWQTMSVPDDDRGYWRIEEVLHRSNQDWRPAEVVLREGGGLLGRGHVRRGHQRLQGCAREGRGLLQGQGGHGEGSKASKTGGNLWMNLGLSRQSTHVELNRSRSDDVNCRLLACCIDAYVLFLRLGKEIITKYSA